MLNVITDYHSVYVINITESQITLFIFHGAPFSVIVIRSILGQSDHIIEYPTFFSWGFGPRQLTRFFFIHSYEVQIPPTHFVGL
jgi:hypothetical protein